MSKLISFESYKPIKEIISSNFYRATDLRLNSKSQGQLETDTPDIQETIDLLLKQNPGKLLYSQKDAAKTLCVSYPFINRCCVDGKIKTVKLGSRQLININEMAKLITQGMNNVN